MSRVFLPAVLVCALILTGSSPSQAFDYSWTDGWYVGSTVSPGLPTILSADDTLTVGPKTNTNNAFYDAATGYKVFGGLPDVLTLDNHGSIYWTDSSNTWYVYHSADFYNHGLFEASAGGNFWRYSGSDWGHNFFVNMASGTFRKTGTGNLTFAYGNYHTDETWLFNHGILDARDADSTITYNTPQTQFLDGTRFAGAGKHIISPTSNTSFSGHITIDSGTTVNLDASVNGVGGSTYTPFTGVNAVIYGDMILNVGSLQGSWTLAPNASVTTGFGVSGRTIMSATIENQGTININYSSLGFGSSTINNTGMIDFQSDWDFVYGGDGGQPTLINSGIIRKSGGTGTSQLGLSGWNGINLTHLAGGKIEVLTGTLSIECPGFNTSYGDIKVAPDTKLMLQSPLTNYGTIEGSGIIEVLAGNRQITNYGTVRPGQSPGTLTIQGDFAQATDGQLVIELGGTGAGMFDVLAVSGNVNLNGILVVKQYGGYVPQMGDTFNFLTYGGQLSGGFDNIIFDGFNGIEFSNITLSPTGLSISVIQVPEPATMIVLALGGLTLRRKRSAL